MTNKIITLMLLFVELPIVQLVCISYQLDLQPWQELDCTVLSEIAGQIFTEVF